MIGLVDHRRSVTSTQDVLGTLAHAPHLTTIRADVQIRGRGRLGRTWESGAGRSLLASTLVVLPATAALRERGGFLTLIGALSMRAALADFGAPAKVKFPNDVVIRGRKICGVLGEFYADMSAARGELSAAIGVGANVFQEGDELFEGATSLAAEGLLPAEDLRPDDADPAGILLDRYLAELAARVEAFAADPNAPATAPIIAELNVHLAQRGQQVSMAGRTGVVDEIGPDGELILTAATAPASTSVPAPNARPEVATPARIRVYPHEVAMFAEHNC